MNLELVARTVIQMLCRVGGGGGADDKFVTLFVKKEYGLVSTRSQLYRARPESVLWGGFSNRRAMAGKNDKKQNPKFYSYTYIST